MQDSPDAAELLDAVAAYLFAELRDQVPRGERFRVLVAANACAVVARELRAGPEPDLADRELFADLLDQDSGEATASREAAGTGDLGEESRELATRLVGAIRSGERDADLDSLLERLRPHVARKLEVSRPGYGDSPG